MRVLHLTLKKKWYDLIKSGVKTEEYREIKPYWISRLHRVLKSKESIDGNIQKEFDIVHFYNGAAPSLNYPNFKIEYKGLEIGEAKPEWSDSWQGEVFIIKLGKVISRSNC